jgi:hypothetical protein
MPAGESAPAEYSDYLRSNLAWCGGEIEVAVAEREVAIRCRRVVAPYVLPPVLTRVGKTAVEFNSCPEGRIEHVAVLVVVAAAISALAFARRQPVRTFDVFVVPALQNRVQASRIECQQFAELRPPAHLGSAVDGAR